MSASTEHARAQTTAGGEPETVATWPRLSAVVRDDARGTLTVNGTQRPCAATSIDELRTGVIAYGTAVAQRVRRPVLLTVSDGGHSWRLAVRPEGVVQMVNDAGSILPADGLAPHEGRCRSCRRLQSVTSRACAGCGIEDPHRIVLEAGEEPALRLIPHEPPRRTTVRLTFGPGHELECPVPLVIGTDPRAEGCTGVKVASPEGLMSRTHLSVELSRDGHLMVRDAHSTNGTVLYAATPTLLDPGAAHRLDDGATLLLGDVRCTISRV